MTNEVVQPPGHSGGEASLEGRWWQNPLLQFVLFGGLVFAAYGVISGESGSESQRVVSVSQQEQLAQRALWEAQWNRPPTQEEFNALIDQLVREKVLAREAVVLGLDVGDVVIRRRLALKIETLTDGLADLRQPSAQELLEYFEAHREEYQVPSRLTFTQVFLNPDVRGDATWDDAGEILARVEAEGLDPTEAIALGDRSMLQAYFPAHSFADVRRAFGSVFADSLFAVAGPGWNRPLASGFGLHVVFIHEAAESIDLTWEQAEPQVLEDWRAQQRADANVQLFETLLAAYEVRIEEPGDGDDGSGGQ